MDINDKKLNRTRKIINFFISVILAVFLILLSNTIINDLDRTIEHPKYNDFNDETEEVIQAKIEDKALSAQVRILEESDNTISKMIRTAKDNKEAEQESFDNWIKTRSTLGSPSQDPEVLKRINKLDDYQKVVQEWTAQSDSITQAIQNLYAKQTVANEVIDKHSAVVQKKYEKAEETYDLKVFLIRLLFTSPILILGVFLFLRRRNHKLSPLFMGFSLFSIYVFFIGLVPYLPSYGGYIRYSVGVLLTIGLGYYAIKRLRDYSERKQMELKASTAKRASMLQTDTAEKAFNNHICPSCGKDFIIRNWEGLVNANIQSAKPVASKFCRFCGMQLVKNCGVCQQENYAHLPYCINCGESLKAKMVVVAE